MRLPPDVLAVLIKIKDYFLIFGPVLVAAITFRAILLASLSPGSTAKFIRRKWQKVLTLYLKGGKVLPGGLKSLLRLPPVAPAQESSSRNIWRRASYLTVAPTALLTALTLSPLLVFTQILLALPLSLISFLFPDKVAQPELEPSPTATKTIKKSQAKKLPQKWLERFKNLWIAELDAYSWPTFYNFLLAALVTIFIPLRVIESWFGIGYWYGPILIPLLGLLLLPASGSEMALVLALFVKGVSTGSGVAALLTFPLISLVRLVNNWQQYGLKPTIKLFLAVWLLASGLGVLLDIFGIEANV